MTVKNGAKKVVSATLAGLMAVGTVPVAAFAESAQNTSNEQGVELQSETSASTFAAGKPTISIDGAVATTQGSEGAYSVSTAYNGNDHSIVIDSVTLGDGTVVELEPVDGQNKFPVTYQNKNNNAEKYTVKTTNTVDTTTVGHDAGTYTIKLIRDYDGATLTFKVNVTATTLDGASLYEQNPADLSDVSDTTFTYNGSALSILPAIGNKALKKDVDYSSVTYQRLRQGGDASHTHQGDPLNDTDWETIDASDVKDAVWPDGSTVQYRAVITGTGNYSGTKAVNFTIDKLDLSKASIDVQKLAGRTDELDASVVSVNGKDNVPGIGISLKGSDDKQNLYTYNVAADGKDNNVTGSQDVTVSSVYQYLNAATITYAGNQVKDGSNLGTFDLDNGQSFNADNFKVVGKGNQVINPSAYNVTVQKQTGVDDQGKAVYADSTLDEVNKGGNFKVTLTANAADNGYNIDGSVSYTLSTTHANAAKVYVNYNGKLAGDGTYGSQYNGSIGVDTPVYYDGNDLLNDVKITVTDAKGNVLRNGVDYKVTYKKLNDKALKADDFKTLDEIDHNNRAWEDVDNITDAGWYQIVVSTVDDDNPLSNYHFENDGQSVTDDYTAVDVQKLPVTVAIGTSGSTNDESGAFFYTGSDINVPFVFTSAVSGKTVDVDPSNYTVEYTLNGQKVDSVKDAGDYTVRVRTKDESNYVLTDSADGKNGVFTGKFTVTNATHFIDVPTSRWDAQYVEQIHAYSVMNGYRGTNIFGAFDNMTRGQVARALYNLAKESTTPLHAADDWANEAYKDANGNYVTGFSDVDASSDEDVAAISWAEDAGIVHGYGDGTFRPEQNITREELAIMLANYAKVAGTYSDADASVLSAYGDGTNVDDWAKSQVQWAVASKLMGVDVSNLRAKDPIVRSEVAAMLVRFIQANGLI